MHGAPLVCLQCSDREGYNCFSLSPVRPQMQRKIDAQKALHSCSISSFTASIIKSGCYRLSNPNFPISWRWPAQSHPRWVQGKRLLLGLSRHHVCRTWLYGRLGCWHLLCGNSLDEHVHSTPYSWKQPSQQGGEIMKALTSRFQGVMFNYCTIAIEFPPLTIQSSTMKLRQQDLAQKNKQRLLFHKLFAPLHFKSHQSNMKRINHFHTLVLKNRSFLRWLTPAERQKLANYLCVMAASKLQDQLFLLCCNCRGLSSCVWHKAGLGRLTTDQKHKQDYRSLTFHSAHERQQNPC